MEIGGGFALGLDAGAVDQRVVVCRQTLSLEVFDSLTGEHPQRESVFSGELEGQIKDIRAAAVSEAMPIEMRRV